MCEAPCSVDEVYYKRKTIPRGKNCPPGYEKETPTQCRRIVPKMSDAEALACCVDPSIQSNPPDDIINRYKCNSGFCPKGNRCVAWMGTRCRYGWDKSCDAFINNLKTFCTADARDVLYRASQGLAARAIQTPKDLTLADAGYDGMLAQCPTLPGVCDDALMKICSRYTREEALKSPRLRRVCGCFLPPTEYPYGKAFSYQCDLMCTNNAQGPTIQRGINESPDQRISAWEEDPCSQNVCLIDGVTINLAHSTGSGKVNFSTVCGECDAQVGGGGKCQCYISNVDINIIDSYIKSGDIDLEQHCGRCFTDDASGGGRKEIDCKDIGKKDPHPDPGGGGGGRLNIPVVTFIILGVALLIWLAIAYLL